MTITIWRTFAVSGGSELTHFRLLNEYYIIGQVKATRFLISYGICVTYVKIRKYKPIITTIIIVIIDILIIIIIITSQTVNVYNSMINESHGIRTGHLQDHCLARESSTEPRRQIIQPQKLMEIT